MKLSVFYIYFFSFFFLFFAGCDTRKTYFDKLLHYNLIGTYNSNTIYGMVGDSWTDFAFAGEVVMDLHDHLVERYKLPITSSNIAGLRLVFEVDVRKGYLNVIREAGPNIRYMLLSIGGNDLQFPLIDYYNQGFDATFQQRTSLIKEYLKILIQTGNYYKLQLYGGEPLIWFIHGYDYPDPIKDNSCIKVFLDAGMNIEDAKIIIPDLIDKYNQFLQDLTKEIPSLYYIDLRKTMGGPPFSNSSLMFDCIHPNSYGFSLLADRYVNFLKIYNSL